MNMIERPSHITSDHTSLSLRLIADLNKQTMNSTKKEPHKMDVTKEILESDLGTL